MCARRGPGGSSRAVHLRSVTSYGSAPIVRGSRMRSGHLRFGRMVASEIEASSLGARVPYLIGCEDFRRHHGVHGSDSAWIWVGRLRYKTNSLHSGQTAQTCCSPWCTQRHIPNLDGNATPGRHKSRALHLGAGAEEEEIIQRDKRFQVGEQFLHDRSNLGSNLACIPLLLHGVRMSGRRCTLTPQSKQAPYQCEPRCRRNRCQAHDLPLLRHSAPAHTRSCHAYT
jgi:hypothetical protein